MYLTSQPPRSHLRALGIQHVAVRPTDAQVAVDGDGHHDEGGEGDIAGDEEEVHLAQRVVGDGVVQRLHDDGEGHDDTGSDEVCGRQADDEDGGRDLVFLAHVDVEDEGVAEGSQHGEEGQHADD